MTQTTRNVEINGKHYYVNEDNQLVDRNSWDQDIMQWLANNAQIDLRTEHQTALTFIRDVYAKRDRHPMVRVVAAHLAEKHGPEKGSLKFFYSLFPKGIQQAVILAGVPVTGLCY